MRRTLIASLVALALLDGAQSDAGKPAAKLLVRAARIYTGAPEGGKVPAFLEPGALLIVDGKVAEIASSIEQPGDAELLDLGSGVVMPGIVDASTTLAGTSDYLGFGVVWKDDAVAAQFDPTDSFDRFADRTATLLGGVTTVYLSCGDRRLVSGQGAVAKLASRDGGAALLSRQSALEINLGDSSLRPPVNVVPPLPPAADHPIQPGEAQLPTTRVGQLLGVREAFARARDAAKAGATGDLSLVALNAAIAARRPLRFHADSAADLLRAVQLARDLGHPALIVGAAEGALVAEQLAAARYPVVVEIGLQLDRPPEDRSLDPDAPRLRPETAAELVRRGVKVALATPAGRDPADVLLAGAIALRGGLTTEQAVAALTRVPAEILGVGHRVGCLLPGKDADFVVLSGEPFLRNSYVQRVFVEGRMAAEPASVIAASKGGGSVVIRAGTVLTALGEPIHNGAVVVQDGRILAVGAEVPVPPDARVIDAGANAVLTPGFIDCNSHLEFGEDRTNVSLDLDVTQIVAFANDDALEVARHGVTTAIVQTWQAHQSGSRAIAVKTAGSSRQRRVVDSLAAVKQYWRGPFDPLATEERFRNDLKRAKDYSDKWIKYLEDLKKWEEEQQKKSPEQAAAEKAKAEADAKKDEGATEVSKEKKADPITGKWDVTVSGGPISEPQPGTMRLKLEGTKITGSLAALFGDDEQPTELSGSLADKHVTLELDVDTPMGKPVIVGDLDAEDHLRAKLNVGPQFSFDFEGKRTDKEFVEVVTVKKKKKGPEGKPAAPDVQPELEPYRRVFAGEAPILLECDSAIGIRHALKVLGEFKVEVVLLGADELLRLPRAEWQGAIKGVVVPEQIEVPRLGRLLEPPEVSRAGGTFVPAAELSRLGVPVGFQSHGVNAARGLALNAAYAVRRGMDPRAALRALTIEPAKFFHVDDQVGALEPGKQGDVLVFSGDPFELSTRLLRVFVNGEELALETKP